MGGGEVYYPPPPPRAADPPTHAGDERSEPRFFRVFSSFFAFNHDRELDLVVIRLNSVKLRQKQLFAKLSKL